MLTSKLYPNHVIYGPYTNNEGRKYVTLVGSIKFSIMYSRFLIQEKLNRLLTKDEEVDHIDENVANDNINNLLVLTVEEHRRLHHAIGLNTYNFECHNCCKSITLTRRQLTYLRGSRKRGQTGPFCSKRCSGLYGKQFQ